MREPPVEPFAPDPIPLLQRWIDDAIEAGVVEPTAMCAATSGGQGHPTARMVLLRGLDDRGLRFYTSYFSRKGRELSELGRIACVFWWGALERQVRIEGSVTQLSEDESDAYFESRPRGHRLAAWASEQSEPVDSRQTLEDRYAHFQDRFEGEDVPRPHSWGGYLIAPDRFEFWQGRPNRLHDRAEYLREGSLWITRRLSP
jgi:pyridoxamine 5'-phosphate oxidase